MARIPNHQIPIMISHGATLIRAVTRNDDSVDVAVTSTLCAVRSGIRVWSAMGGRTVLKALTSRTTAFPWTLFAHLDLCPELAADGRPLDGDLFDVVRRQLAAEAAVADLRSLGTLLRKVGVVRVK